MYNYTMKRPYLLIPLLCLALLAACSEPKAPAAVSQATPAVLSLTSPAFDSGATIPQKYSCQGEDISPALDFSAPPANTKSLALLVDDPDAPAGTWTHWVVYNLPAEALKLAEGASRAKGQPAQLPSGAVQGKNSFNRGDYGGPCPPSGTHHYYFRLYALDITLPADPPLDRPALLKAMDGHVLGQGELMGTYQK